MLCGVRSGLSLRLSGVDNQILREEGTSAGQKAAWVIFPILVTVLVVFYASQDHLTQYTTALIFFFVVAMVVTLLVAWRIERPTAFATRGPNSRAQVYTQAPQPVVTAALVDALRRTSVIVEESDGVRVVGRKKVNFTSWGTRVFVDLRPSADRPGLGVVTVVVRPSYPLQVSDWGKSVKLATRLASSVPGIVDVVPPKR